jgi:hypothetical protein
MATSSRLVYGQIVFPTKDGIELGGLDRATHGTVMGTGIDERFVRVILEGQKVGKYYPVEYWDVRQWLG